MQINIDEYDMEFNCYQDKETSSQPRVVLSISQEGAVHGEIHLHKKADLACYNGPMIPDHKGKLVTRSFVIDDESKYYEECAKIVMEYIRMGYEITYLKLI